MSFYAWREVAAVVAHTLHFSLGDLLEMPFDELVEWHRVAAKINDPSKI